jgi:archaeoflavoprotein AfpA
LTTTTKIEPTTQQKRKKVAWGITGAGDKLAETVNVMKEIKNTYGKKVQIDVYLSKAGEQVAKAYKLREALKYGFERVLVEVSANSPFLAGLLQTRKYEFLLIAPASSNTVAKFAVGIADTMLCNAAIMALKGFVPVYVMPSDYREGVILTRLPNGTPARLRVRKDDAENVRKLEKMDDVFVFEKPDEIKRIFKKHFQHGKPQQKTGLSGNR